MAGKTLDELEGVVWGKPTFESYLVTTCHHLRTKPVDEFTVEDLRIMVGQGIGLSHLVPRAVAVLEREPLAEGDYYPGDLLSSVIGTGKNFGTGWHAPCSPSCRIETDLDPTPTNRGRRLTEMSSYKETRLCWVGR